MTVSVPTALRDRLQGAQAGSALWLVALVTGERTTVLGALRGQLAGARAARAVCVHALHPSLAPLPLSQRSATTCPRG